jgi:hypothetical protein
VIDGGAGGAVVGARRGPRAGWGCVIPGGARPLVGRPADCSRCARVERVVVLWSSGGALLACFGVEGDALDLPEGVGELGVDGEVAVAHAVCDRVDGGGVGADSVGRVEEIGVGD